MTTIHQLIEDLKEIKHGVGACIHIENFTCINLSLGFATGLQLIHEFGHFLTTMKPDSCTIYHIGREEFFYLSTEFSEELMFAYIQIAARCTSQTPIFSNHY